jgi:transcription-repair coupling factor (superfamily II helicase)
LTHSLLIPRDPQIPQAGDPGAWGRLIGASGSLAVAEFSRALSATKRRPVLILAEDPRHADQLESEIRFFTDGAIPVVHFVEWETLPWDNFSPHQDIVSQRLEVLATLADMSNGVIIATVGILHQRLPPLDYVAARSLSLTTGQELPREDFTRSLVESGYLRVPQVSEHGEFAVRGSLIDIFPMGTDAPVRIDFFDDDIESLRFFSPENQLSGKKVDSIRILPAREVPLDAAAIAEFRDRYRERFEGQPGKSRVYREVSDGIAHGGIEYYLPLFFESTATFADYLPGNCVVLSPDSLESLLEQFWSEARERYAMASLDKERPVLTADETFIAPDKITSRLDAFSRIRYSAQSLSGAANNFDTRMPPAMKI